MRGGGYARVFVTSCLFVPNNLECCLHCIFLPAFNNVVLLLQYYWCSVNIYMYDSDDDNNNFAYSKINSNDNIIEFSQVEHNSLVHNLLAILERKP